MKQGTGIGALAERLRRRQIPSGWIVIPVLLILLVILPFVWKQPFYVNIFILIFLFGYLATAWGLVGQSGQLSFGHAAFFGLGAYTSTLLYTQVGVSPWLGMLVGAVVAVIAGAIIGYPTLRLRGVYFALATLAFCVILQIYVRNTQFLGPLTLGASSGLWITPYAGAKGPLFYQFASKTPFYFIALGMLVGVVSLSHLLNRVRLGYYWRAMRSDPDASESLGINVGRYRLMTFLLSCALTALGGSFYAQYFYFISPDRVLDISLSVEIVLVGVVGGWQTVFGPMIGAFIIIPISHIISAQLGSTLFGLHIVVYGIILMLFILYLPRGLNIPVMRGLRWLEAKLQRQPESSSDKPRRKPSGYTGS